MGFSWTLGYTGFVGVIGFLALVVGGPYLLEKFFKVPVLSAVRRFPLVGRLVNPAFAGILGIALVVLVALPYVASDTAKSFGSTQTPLALDAGDTTTTTDTTAVAVCNRPQGGNTANYLLAVENKDNPADAYIASAVSVVKSDGTVDQTGNTLAGTTLSYVTLAVSACESGTIYVTSNSSQKVAYNTNQPQTSVTLDGSLITNMTMDVLNFNTGSSLLGNGTRPTATTGICPTDAINCGVNAAGVAGNDITVTNQTVGSGGSFNFKFTLLGATANGRFGPYANTAGDGFIISAKMSDLTSSSAANGLKLAGIDGGVTLTAIPCPQDIASNRVANKCWKGGTLKSGVTYTGSGTVACDLGDCAPQDYIDLCFDDLQWTKDNDGVFKLIAFTDSGTNVGAVGTCARFFLN